MDLYRMFENKLHSDESLSKFDDMSLDPTIYQTHLNENKCNSFSRYFEV